MNKSKLKSKIKNELLGLWHITKMETWDEDYFNMEVQAYIRITSSTSGEFQFGLVTGDMDGRIMKGEQPIFDFTWEGSEEGNEESGDGWMKINENETAEGEIRIHNADSSLFWAKKVKDKEKTMR